ncbi:MAG: bifunctional 5,10-methylenetetrahydrofolate dehydrogenase/5,10-methenyltetrahydrofolate cyclohydrolase [Candidatus Berkelbacteria bacterium]|nr:bifunctional 5,10-methylenetetrahydrofolate dehydrogenase/5,10-methenyltetrahydrofolate cyclohydrolase [Candidatus Berkelbacteria bacterium]
MKFDGRKIRDQILSELKVKFAALSTKPTLAVIWIGDDKVSARYIEQKQRAAEFVGVRFDICKFPESVTTKVVEEQIKKLNSDASVTGIMIQLPVPETVDQFELVSAIAPEKDVDALRFCSDIECTFRPPVTLGVLEALKESGINLANSTVAVVGRGFLVGEPLINVLRSEVADLRIADSKTPHLATLTADADVVISATGHAGLIKPDMIKPGAILIDAGTTEIGGKLAGDVDLECYEKSAFYTPVPGGIGPMTVAVLFKNLLVAAQKQIKDPESSSG